MSGHEDDRDGGGPRTVAKLHKRHRSVHDRHRDVEEDEIGRVFGGRRESVHTRSATAHHEFSIEAELHRDDFADVRFVVDVEQAKRRHWNV
jgi:hypothetical protein